ncbi:hypothetical protein [Halorhabdus sp. CBA1104]|uniref:hypothetical protein n=1 Tax=Halorhabdus sp. CBA1104 TaxID=1380432 RepID=UPI0012B21394|nr:hypothetical protein [Halorhabdus sp. CBA1104]
MATAFYLVKTGRDVAAVVFCFGPAARIAERFLGPVLVVQREPPADPDTTEADDRS